MKEISLIDAMEKYSKKSKLLVERKKINEDDDPNDGGMGIRKSNINIPNKINDIKVFMHLDYLDSIMEASLSFGFQPVINRKLMINEIIERVKQNAEVWDIEIPNKYYSLLSKVLQGNVYNKPDRAEVITNEILKRIFIDLKKMLNKPTEDDGFDQDKDYEPSKKDIQDVDIDLKEYNNFKKSVKFDKNKNDSVRIMSVFKEAIQDIILEFQNEFLITKLRRKLPNNIKGNLLNKDTFVYIGEQNIDELYFNPFNSNLSLALRVPFECKVGKDGPLSKEDILSLEQKKKIDLELTKKMSLYFSDISSILIQTLFTPILENITYIKNFKGTKPSDTKF